MWITNRQEWDPIREPSAELGRVTVAGAETGVALAGERRQVALCGPGGYHWAPRRGDEVLVVKTGPEKAPCVAGKTHRVTVAPGEVYLSAANGAGIRLSPDGSIRLEGRLTLSGSVSLKGNVSLEGNLNILGKLMVNGEEVTPCPSAS